MDLIIPELIGKPKLNPPKLITIVAKDFTFIDQQAILLKAILALPEEKKLPLAKLSFVQVGQIHSKIEELCKTLKYQVYSNSNLDFFQATLQNCDQQSLVVINELSQYGLSPKSTARSALESIDFARSQGKFIIALHETQTGAANSFLRDLMYISDSVIEVTTTKTGYFQKMWWQPMPEHKTLLPTKVQTLYYTCSIGKSFWNPKLLCFHDKIKVNSDYDPNAPVQPVASNVEYYSDDDEPSKVIDDISVADKPYLRAQNPEQSRIFYYPDKDDDIDEDDPDDDLGI